MDYSVFAMQVAIPHQPGTAAHDGLRQLVARAGQEQTYDDKAAFYRELSGRLLALVPWFAKGIWDFWDDPTRAPGDFQEWVDGLEGKEARHAPAPPANYRGQAPEPRFMLVTFSMLLVHHGNSCRLLSRACNIPQANLWQRASFARILQGVAKVNFASVRSDVVYLVPRDDAYALTPEDLATQDYFYLRELAG